MKYKKRRFIPGECMHIYQRAVNGYIIFYDLEDFLVFYTIFSTFARVYNVQVLELCIMANHVHILLCADKLEEVSRFIMRYTSVFVREYNDAIGRKGPLFHKSFGSAPKKGSKSIRSTIVYIGNNPVEKELSETAEGYRWTFLRYIKQALNSSVMSLRKMNHRLRKACKHVDVLRAKSGYLTYHNLRRLMKGMSFEEKEVLADYIIMAYYPFDTEALLSFYSSYDDMMTAMRSTSGKDYDIKEAYLPEPDTIYHKMATIVRDKVGHCAGNLLRSVTVTSPEDKFMIAKLLRNYTDATLQQISRFLHMEIKNL